MWIVIFLNKSNCFNVYLFILMRITYQQWCKDELILWKSSSIWMKILNNIACNLNWIQIPLKINKIQIGAHVLKIYLSFPSFMTFGVEKKVSLETKDLKKTTLHNPYHGLWHCIWNGQNKAPNVQRILSMLVLKSSSIKWFIWSNQKNGFMVYNLVHLFIENLVTSCGKLFKNL